MTETETRKQVLSSVFRRKGANGAYTRLFESFDIPQQNFLMEEAQLQDQELPIIGSINNSNDWLLLTTERIVWSRRNERDEIPIQDISDALANLPEHKYGPRTKLERKELKIITMRDKKQYVIELESGPPLFGTWHVLKNIGARNRNRKAKIGDSSSL